MSQIETFTTDSRVSEYFEKRIIAFAELHQNFGMAKERKKIKKENKCKWSDSNENRNKKIIILEEDLHLKLPEKEKHNNIKR